MRTPSRPLVVGLGVLAAAAVAVPVAQHVTSGGSASAARRTPTSPVTATDVRHLVALGDSVIAGEAQDGTAFPGLVAESLSRAGAPVQVANLGEGGLTATQLLDRVRHDATTRSSLASADYVLVTAGANDAADSFTDTSDKDCDTACIQQGAAGVRRDVSALLAEIRAVDTRPGAKVVVTTYWNVGLDGAVAHANESDSYYAWTDRVTKATNAALTQAAAEQHASVVDLYAPFKATDATNLLADDGDHPNERGQRLIAEVIERLLAH